MIFNKKKLLICCLVFISFKLQSASQFDDGKLNENPTNDVIGAITGLNSQIPSDLKLGFTVEKFKLSNGITFLLHETHQIPLISYQTWFRVGSKDELPGESGLAHMLEHMMFKGSKKYSNKDFDRILHENGIQNNAFTSWDYTGYYENLPSSKLELIMDIEVDRLMTLQLKSEDLQKEREVVKEERRMRVDNEPNGTAREKLFGSVFSENNYGIPVIGTMKEINEYNVEKLQKFFNKWYVPSNAVVVLVGDFNTAQVRKLIQKYYGNLPGGKVPTSDTFKISEPTKALYESVEFPVQAPTMLWGYKTVPSGDKDAYALDVLGSVLGDGKSSRLHQKLVYKDQVALGASSGHYTLKNSGLFYFGVYLKPGQKPQMIKNQIQEEIKKVSEQGIRDEELQKVKNMIISQYVTSMETLDGKAHLLAMNEILFGDYTTFFKDLEKYKSVTTSDVKAVAQRYLKEARQNLIVVDKKGQVLQ